MPAANTETHDAIPSSLSVLQKMYSITYFLSFSLSVCVTRAARQELNELKIAVLLLVLRIPACFTDECVCVCLRSEISLLSNYQCTKIN